MDKTMPVFLLVILLLVGFSIDFLRIQPVYASPDYEDFTDDWTEYGTDVNQLDQTATRSSWTDMERQDDACLYKNYGSNFFVDFTHDFELNITNLDHGDSTIRNYLRIYEVRDGTGTGNPADGILVVLRQHATSDVLYALRLTQFDGGVNYDNNDLENGGGTYYFSVDTEYYIRLNRTGSTLGCYAYSDTHGGTEIASTSFSCVEDQYDYLQCPASASYAADPTADSSGYVENLDIGAEVDSTPPTYDTTSIDHNTTTAGNPVKFSVNWTDETGLSGYIFGWNGSTQTPSEEFNNGKHANNPIIENGDADDFDEINAARATVLFEDGKFIAWYAGKQSEEPVTQIGFCNISADFQTVTKDPNNPVITAYTDVPWANVSAACIAEPHIIRANESVLVLSFTCDDDDSVWGAIGLAVNTNASDYNDWTFLDYPTISDGGNGTTKAGNSGLVYNDTANILYWFYSTGDIGNRDVWYIESSYDPLDPFNFSWSSPSKVIDDDGGWGVGTSGISDWVPFYVEELNRWEVGARCRPEDRVYFWYSNNLTNGGSWTYLGNPIQKGSSGSWDDWQIAGGRCAINTDEGYMDYSINSSYYFFYDGMDDAGASGGKKLTGVAIGDAYFWSNDSFVSFSGTTWANVSKTLPTTVGQVVGYKWWANDTSDNWNNSMPIQTLTITTAEFSASITINTPSHSWTLNPGDSDILINEGVINVTVTANKDYNIQAKANASFLVCGSWTIGIGNITMHKDTLGSSIPLTTSYQNIPGLTSLPSGTDVEHTFKLWLDCPNGTRDGAYVYTLYVKVVEAT